MDSRVVAVSIIHNEPELQDPTMLIALTMTLLIGGQEIVPPTVDQQMAAGASWAARGIPDACLVEIAEAGGASLDRPGMLEAVRQRAQQVAGLRLMADEMSQESIILLGSSRANLEAAKFLGEISEEDYAQRVEAYDNSLSATYQQLWANRLRETECPLFGPSGEDGLRLITGAPSATAGR